MRKAFKRIVTASLTTLMIAGIGASATNMQINARHRRIHRVYKHRGAAWHKGTPAILRHNSQWLSTPVKIRNGYRDHFMRTITPMGGHYGFNPTPFYFNHNHHFKEGGADAGAGMAVNAHYKTLGYHKYAVKSGTYDNTLTAIVKVHNFNSISIWSDGHYFGTFHRISYHTLHYFIYHPWF